MSSGTVVQVVGGSWEREGMGMGMEIERGGWRWGIRRRVGRVVRAVGGR